MHFRIKNKSYQLRMNDREVIIRHDFFSPFVLHAFAETLLSETDSKNQEAGA